MRGRGRVYCGLNGAPARIVAWVLAASVGLLPAAGVAAGSDWQPAGVGAVAILPSPSAASGIAGASLACAEQRWQLVLRMDAAAPPEAAKTRVRLTVDGDSYEPQAAWSGRTMAIPVSAEALEALKSGKQLFVKRLDGHPAETATFPLKGSRKIVEAVAPRCSQLDMSAYRQVIASPASPAVETATTLLVDEIGLFREATGQTPETAAAEVDAEGGRSLLFATLCGSTSYYGVSGCNLTGFVSDGAGWREVYNTDGMRLYLDAKNAADGWPDLVTVPLQGEPEPLRWHWDGHAYAPPAPVVAEDLIGGGDAQPLLRR